MKNSIITIFLILLFANIIVNGQTNYGKLYSTDFLTIGLGGSYGYNLATNTPPTGTKVAYLPGFRANVDATLPINSLLGFGLSVGLDNRSTGVYDVLDENLKINSNLSYLSVFPFLKISTLVVGVNFGIPKSNKLEANQLLLGNQTYELNSTDMENVEMMIEPRLGALAPLIDEEFGWLGLTFSLGYCVNKMYKSNATTPMTQLIENSKYFDGSLASAHLGLTWQFRVPIYERSRAK